MVIDALKISPDRNIGLHEPVTALPVWNLEGWVAYCAQSLMLWGNVQRSVGLNEKNKRVVRHQSMSRLRQVPLIRTFLELPPRQRIFLSGCRRTREQIYLIRPRTPRKRVRISLATVWKLLQPKSDNRPRVPAHDGH